MIINYQIAILIACVAVVYSTVLTEPNSLLNGFYLRASEFFKNDKREAEGKPLHWAFMLLIGCHKCIAGQWAAWYYVFFCQEYNIFKHIFFVAFTIIAAIKINQWITK